MSKIHLVLFDLGGVVVMWDDKWLYQDVAKKWGIEESLLSAECNRLMPELHCGKLLEHNFWNAAVMKLNSSIKLDLQESMIDVVFRKKAAINMEIFSIINRLRERGIKLGILSNLEKMTFSILEDWGILPNFQYIFASFRIGLAKPSPEIYRYVLKNVPYTADEILLIDDKESNVKAAKKEGMKGIVFHDVTRLNAEFEKLLSGKW